MQPLQIRFSGADGPPSFRGTCGLDQKSISTVYADSRAHMGIMPPAVRVAFGRGPGRRRFSGRGAEAGLAKLPRFLVDRLRHVATI